MPDLSPEFLQSIKGEGEILRFRKRQELFRTAKFGAKEFKGANITIAFFAILAAGAIETNALPHSTAVLVICMIVAMHSISRQENDKRINALIELLGGDELGKPQQPPAK